MGSSGINAVHGENSFYRLPFTMGSSLLDLGMRLMEKVDWNEVKETAKFYYTDSTTTLNLYPALIISVILLFLLVPLLGAIPTIDLFPSSGAPSDGYGTPARNSWSSGGEYRTFQDEESENLKDIYNNDWDSSNDGFNSPVGAAARTIEQVKSPLTNLVNSAMKLIN